MPNKEFKQTNLWNNPKRKYRSKKLNKQFKRDRKNKFLSYTNKFKKQVLLNKKTLFYPLTTEFIILFKKAYKVFKVRMRRYTCLILNRKLKSVKFGKLRKALRLFLFARVFITLPYFKRNFRLLFYSYNLTNASKHKLFRQERTKSIIQVKLYQLLLNKRSKILYHYKRYTQGKFKLYFFLSNKYFKSRLTLYKMFLKPLIRKISNRRKEKELRRNMIYHKNFFHRRWRKGHKTKKKLKFSTKKQIRHYYKRFNRLKFLPVKRYYKKLYTNRSFYSTNRKLMSIYLFKADKFKNLRMPFRKKFKLSYFYPRYVNFDRLFKYQLREQKTFRWLYRLSLTQIIKMFRKVIFNTKNKFEYAFFKFLEFRMDMCLYRLNMAFSFKQARQWVKRGLFYLSGKKILWHKHQVNVGDVLMPSNYLRLNYPHNKLSYDDVGCHYLSLRLYWYVVQKDQYINYTLINERLPAGLIFLNPDVNKVYAIKPWSVQFITLSLLKYT